jgi:hypothetical protein
VPEPAEAEAEAGREPESAERVEAGQLGLF